MANQLYGSTSYGYAGGSNPSSVFTSRPTAEQYVQAAVDPSHQNPSMYLGSDPLSSASNLFASISDKTASIPAGATLWPGPPGVDVNAATLGSIYAGYKRSSEALYQSLLGTHNPFMQSEAWYSANPLMKRPRFQSSLPVYPQRPGEKDCAHYMLTRTCKFGDTCKFDHPLWVPEGGIPDWKEVPLGVSSEELPERPGAQDCPYFLKTQTCKFGPRCKFNHPKDKIAALSASDNTGGSELPERPSEPQCAFYMKTGNCKFGPTCKYHHPKGISLPIEAGNGNIVQTEAITSAVNGSLTTTSVPPFAPSLLNNSKGLPIRPGEADCPFYLKTGSCKYGATCRYNHPERYAMDPTGLVNPALISNPVLPMNLGLVNPVSTIMPTVDPQLGQPMVGLTPAVHPQRPGQMECDYYMKTGECMFGERCKFHHPPDRAAHALSAKENEQNITLTLAGLPRREGAVHCPYYMKTGACKYGATCKFDHPPPGELIASAISQALPVVEQVKDGQKQN